MKYPDKEFCGFTWVGWLNIFILQWFFVRLQGAIEEDGKTQWQIIIPVVPLTGWFSDYVPDKRKTLKLRS